MGEEGSQRPDQAAQVKATPDPAKGGGRRPREREAPKKDHGRAQQTRAGSIEAADERLLAIKQLSGAAGSVAATWIQRLVWMATRRPDRPCVPMWWNAGLFDALDRHPLAILARRRQGRAARSAGLCASHHGCGSVPTRRLFRQQPPRQPLAIEGLIMPPYHGPHTMGLDYRWGFTTEARG